MVKITILITKWPIAKEQKFWLKVNYFSTSRHGDTFIRTTRTSGGYQLALFTRPIEVLFWVNNFCVFQCTALAS